MIKYLLILLWGSTEGFTAITLIMSGCFEDIERNHEDIIIDTELNSDLKAVKNVKNKCLQKGLCSTDQESYCELFGGSKVLVGKLTGRIHHLYS